MRILVANFFPAFFPPSSGGEQRYYHLYRHLSRWHDVTLFSATYVDKPAELVEHSRSFREYRMPKPPVTDSLHWELHDAGIGDECSAYVVGLAGGMDSDMRRRFLELVPYADAVVHESPFTFPLDATAYRDAKPRIYASYNVEHRLAAQMLKSGSGRAATRFIRFVEGLLVDRADLVFATSEEERGQFVRDFGCDAARIRLAPNGFEPAAGAVPPASGPAEGTTPYAVFLGSGHPPNVEAATFICDQLAGAVPGMEFRIMGSVCKWLKGQLPSNVRLLGFVEEDEMRRQLAGCAAALNPLFTGAGTNLKMLQYMEAGAPILTTPVGARGLDLEDEVGAIVRDSDAFAGELQRLVASPGLWHPIGARARKDAYGKYTWERIATEYSSALEALPKNPRRGVRPRILSVNDYPVTARRGGGAVRIFELLREGSADFEIELLSLTDDAASEKAIAPDTRQRAFPKTAEHREAELAADAGQIVSVRDIVAAEWISRNESFMTAFRASASRADVVVFEHCYLAPLIDHLPDHVRVLYSSQNVEEDMKKSVLRPREDAAAWSARAAELERRVAGRAHGIIAVSREDARVFGGRYPGKQVVVMENGVTEPDIRAERSAGAEALAGRASAAFIGSAHPPNTEAARYIVEILAPGLPAIDFHLIGSVCQAIAHLPIPANVICHGIVSERQKSTLLADCTVAINPMDAGGGSSLKVPDFLAAGLPLLSTRLGVRGFELRPGVDYVEADRVEFGDKLAALARDATVRARVAASGRRAIQRVSWGVIGARYRRFLRSQLRARKGPPIRMLVATYRLMEPAPGGAESYLNNLLANLGATGDITIDVAACDTGSISDRWHFSALYGPPAQDAGTPAGVNRVFRFPLDAPAPDVFAKCRILFAAWMRESRRQCEELFDRLPDPLLLGGWNFTEKSAGVAWRWSSLGSQIGIGEGIGAIRVEGTNPAARRVALCAGTRTLAETTAIGAFVLEAALEEGRQIVELAVETPFLAVDDPRELGAAIQRVSLRGAAGWVDLDLETDAEAVMRASAPGLWIDTLIGLTEERDAKIDDLFLEVRGPHSQPMRTWIDQHAGDYDVVLVQGTPFAPIAWVPPLARSSGVPVVLLPHFHVEDRYYHWKGYYRAFRDADCVLGAPDSTRDRFFRKIDAPVELVPGGGIDADEFAPEHLERCRREFMRVHNSEHPFALVLGRKSGGKRYSLVLEAARAAGGGFDIVMIGPDGDGLPIDQPGVHYYGPRPRELVLGALAACLCLVNMSDSESFGIVLVEAWAAGRPVLAQRRCVAFAELVEHGVNGLLVESPDEIRQGILGYLADRGTAARHGAAGRTLAQRFTWSAVAEQIRQKIFGTVLAGVDSAHLAATAPEPIAPRGAAGTVP